MAPLLNSARAALSSSTASSASFASSSSSSRAVLSRSAVCSLGRRSYAEAAPADPQAGVKRKDRVRVPKDKMFEDFQYDETTTHGHELIQKEREALAFMRTVEIELPKLKPIPFTPPNPTKDYIRFHTQKTWPIEDKNSKESSVVTLSAPVVRLPLSSDAARHKFLLLTTPEYYHPFRPAGFDPYYKIRYAYAYQSPTSPVYNEGSPSTFLPPAVILPAKNNRTNRRMLHRAPVPRVGGWTPSGLGIGAGKALEWDTRFFAKLADRAGEDLDGWVSIKCNLFPFQLQNKKWCEDTLRRLVNEANDMTDPMTDIPLDLSPYFMQWRQQKRRADGSRFSARDLPEEWNLTPEQRASMDAPWLDLQSQIQTSYDAEIKAGGTGLASEEALERAEVNAQAREGRESGYVSGGTLEEWESGGQKAQ